jgi:hypothetical protein
MKLQRILWFLVLAVACKRSAPASEATRGSAAVPPEHAAPPATAPATAQRPIDPTKPMPAESLSTSATLQLGKPATVTVDGRADIFSSGMDAAAQPGGGHVVFSNVQGSVGWSGNEGSPADGDDSDTEIQEADGISGIVDHQHSMFMVGVFLGAQRSTEAPPALDFSAGALGAAFPELSPRIAQTFFIGDGLTPSGATQRFAIPEGATRLYLGFADALAFKGEPGAYDDNTGGIRATAMQQK